MNTRSGPILPGLLIHGGAGELDDDLHDDAKRGCHAAVQAGLDAIAQGKPALDIVQAAVMELEKNPVFNAGIGSALTRIGTVECDASIMDGQTLQFGGVASMRFAPSAISIARKVLEDVDHSILCSDGAWEFAIQHGFSPAPPEIMITPRAKARWEAARLAQTEGKDLGTVGAVAIDAQGNVAAATSTGGRTWKRVGRVGDSPLPGCGTCADSHGGAASATGRGESIMKVNLTRRCVDLMTCDLSGIVAAQMAVAEMEERVGGDVGIISVSVRGEFGAALNARVMPWGIGIWADNQSHIATDVKLPQVADLRDVLTSLQRK